MLVTIPGQTRQPGVRRAADGRRDMSQQFLAKFVVDQFFEGLIKNYVLGASRVVDFAGRMDYGLTSRSVAMSFGCRRRLCSVLGFPLPLEPLVLTRWRL
jgi:hypothetical protein